MCASSNDEGPPLSIRSKFEGFATGRREHTRNNKIVWLRERVATARMGTTPHEARGAGTLYHHVLPDAHDIPPCTLYHRVHPEAIIYLSLDLMNVQSVRDSIAPSHRIMCHACKLAPTHVNITC